MSKSILRPQKLRKLPENVQRVINSLDTTQLSFLQAAFSNHDFFDFLELPLEIRLMVYRFAMGTEKNCIRVDRLVTPVEKYEKAGLVAVPCLALLAVSQEIHAEAGMVLKELKHCILEGGNLYKSMRAHQKRSLRFFRHFTIQISTAAPTEYMPGNTELASTFRKLREHIVKGHKWTEKFALITVHIRFAVNRWGWRTMEPRLSASEFCHDRDFGVRNDAYRNLRYKTLLELLIKDWHRQLRKDLLNLVLTSNADGKWPDVRVRCLDDKEVRVVDTKHHIMSRLSRVDDRYGAPSVAVTLLPYQDPDTFLAGHEVEI